MRIPSLEVSVLSKKERTSFSSCRVEPQNPRALPRPPPTAWPPHGAAPDLYVLPALTQALSQEGHHILVVVQQLSHQLAVLGLIRLVLDLQVTES